jgi:glycosyltransferase involved in cell wall biosynthesis
MTKIAPELALYLPSLRGGGAERVMVLLANGFAARGYSVDLVLAKAEGPYIKDVAAEVRVIDLQASRVALSLPGLVHYLRCERPMAMLSAMGHANVVAVAARMLARVSTRNVVSEHANLSISRKNARSIRGRFMRHFLRWAYSRANGVVTVSGGVADDLAPNVGLSRKFIDVVYNPVVMDELHNRACLKPSHPWFDSESPPVILGVGRLERQKDFCTLIRAFAKLRETHDARLMILGEGSLLGELTNEVEGLGLEAEVSFPGFVGNPYAFMRSSSLFVLSSAWEGFGNVLVEAMACGTPVVSTDCPSGPSEILENGKWGRLVPVGDADSLARAMKDSLDEPAHPDVAARAAHFSVDRAVESYLKVLLAEGMD